MTTDTDEDPSHDAISIQPKQGQDRFDQAVSEYKKGCHCEQSENFQAALSHFKKSVELYGSASPDIHRNMAWCYYRLAEIEGFSNHFEEALSHFRKSMDLYIEAEIGFNDMKEQQHSEKVLKKIELRISECDKRRIYIDALMEYLERNAKFHHA